MQRIDTYIDGSNYDKALVEDEIFGTETVFDSGKFSVNPIIEEILSIDSIIDADDSNGEIEEADINDEIEWDYEWEWVRNITNIYYSDIYSFELIDREEEIRLWTIIQTSVNKEEKDLAIYKFITANLRITKDIASGYINASPWLELLDLIQEWNKWLLKAVKKFDPTKWNKFYSYAIWWVKQAISRYIASKSWVIYIPTNEQESMTYLYKAKISLSNKLLREPTDEELAIKLNKSVKYVKGLRERASTVHSKSILHLDYPIWEDEKGTYLELVKDEDSLYPEELCDNQNLKDKLNTIMESFSERERKIIELRFWLNWNDEHPLQEIWDKLWISRERVRQIEKSIKWKFIKILDEKWIDKEDLY